MPDIQKCYLLGYSVSDVYAAWVSDKTVIPPATKMRVEPTVGGKYTIICQMGEAEWVMDGTFEVVVPNEKLVYKWEWNKDGAVSRVTVLFSEAENGTRIELTHTDLADEALDAHDTGWDSYIEGFEKHLAESSPPQAQA